MSVLPAHREAEPVRLITLPFEVASAEFPEPGETISQFVARTGWATRLESGLWSFRLPTICVVNGAPVLQADWANTPAAGVCFWSRPWGGGGGNATNTAKTVGGIIALIALTALAGPAGTAAATAIGLPGLAGAITGAIVIGGGILISEGK